MTNKKPPIFLDLTKVKYPPMAIVSILHRISGVIIFLALPLLVDWLQQSLQSPNSYAQLSEHFQHPFIKLILWGVLTATIFHLIAGIRHLFMDMGIGESLQVGRVSALTVIILTIIIAVLLGVWLW